MEFHVITSAWIKEKKNKNNFKACLAIRKWPEDNSFEFIQLKDRIRYVLKEKYCIGFATHHPRYFHNPCENGVRGVIKCKTCRKNNKSHICEICDGKNCKIPELDYFCLQEHVMYIAAFSPKDIKIGTSSINSFENRIVEQGPFFVLKIAIVPNKFIARQFERTISHELEIPDKINISIKERVLLNKLNEEIILARIENIIEKLKKSNNEVINKYLFSNIELIDMKKYYNIKFIIENNKDFLLSKYNKCEMIEGTVKMNIGSFSIIEREGSLFILNLRKLSGWIIDTESKGSQQSNLSIFNGI